MFFGRASSPAQNASVTVMESPKWANVPDAPVNRECTTFIGATQSAVARVDSIAIAEQRSEANMTITTAAEIDRTLISLARAHYTPLLLSAKNLR
jgi:hypothetical protein